MTEPRDEFDSPWKDILEVYFQDFIQFFFPHIHPDIDWNRGYDFLDQELRQVVRDAELGKRLVDKLVKVWKLGGEETWVLAHIEIVRRESRALGANALLGLRLRSLLGLLAPSSHVTGSLTPPTLVVSNEPDGMQGTKATLQRA